tara:strand:+ start:37 stop:672 length:636 start_codon:yes stop_codon:yes gene_type:complete
MVSQHGRLPRVIFLLIFTLVALSTPGLRATSVLPPEFEELVQESDFVVRGRVTAVESAWQVTGKSRVIVTKVSVEVLELIAGEAPSPLVLTMLGGKVGEQEMVVEGAPRFAVGEEDILFVQGNGRQVSPLTRMMHGRYRVEKDAATGRSYVARNNGDPLTETSEVAPLTHAPDEAAIEAPAARISRALTPEDFVRRIRAVKPASPVSRSVD